MKKFIVLLLAFAILTLETTIAAQVKEEETLNAKNYPRVDGSTANMPLMAQIRSDVLSENLITSQNNTKVSTTDYAWRSLNYRRVRH